MNLYGNQIWNSATPNSEKAVMVTSKDHLDDAVRALDETGVNYCYYIKDNAVTIAFARISINKSELETLKKIPALHDLAVIEAKGNYTPKTSVIGNTAYKEIKNRHYQKLETDLALKVANELNQNGIHFSGRIYGTTTTITVDNADQKELERIVKDIVNVRNSFKRKIENIDRISSAVSMLPSDKQIVLESITELCYVKGESFSETLISELPDIEEMSPEQIKMYSDLFREAYGNLDESEFLFADTTKLTHFKDQVKAENKLTEITYLKGFSPEQKDSIRRLIEQDVSDSILSLVDYEFTPEQIDSIPEIIKGENGYERLIGLVSEVKNIEPSVISRQIRNNTYQSETARLEYNQFDIEHYDVFFYKNVGLYRIPIKTTAGLLNRLAEHGITPKDEMDQVIIETDVGNWNKLTIPDKYGNKFNNINISDVLTSDEMSVVREVINEVVRLEQTKQLTHENGMPFSSRYSERIDDIDDPYVYDGTMSPEDFKHRQELTETQKTDVGEETPKADGFGSKDKNSTLIVNIYGGPGAGKSTAALQLVAELKKQGFHAEYVSEVAKDYVYAKRYDILDGSAANQEKMFLEQKQRLDLLLENVDIAVTDSPLPLYTVYLKEEAPEYIEKAFSEYNTYQNLNFYLTRDLSVKFEREGRIHNLEESIQKDDEIKNMLDDHSIAYTVYQRSEIDRMTEIIGNEVRQETKAEVPPDSLYFNFGENDTPSFVQDENGTWIGNFTESDLLHEFVLDTEALGGRKISFALANALVEYLDEKQHTEREITELKAGFYKKTDFFINATIGGDEFNYGGRFDIGDGKDGGGGSIIDHMKAFVQWQLEKNPYHADQETLNWYQRDKDILIPYLEEHSALDAEEQRIFDDFKKKNPIRHRENSFDKAVRLLNEYCEKEFDTKANLSNLDHIDIGYTTDEITDIDIQVYADLETYRIVTEYGSKTAKEELFADLNEMNIALESLDFEELVSLSNEEKLQSGVMTDKEAFFFDCDLSKLLAKSSLAWDEIESLGYIFFDKGYIDRHTPILHGHFGNGMAVNGAKAFELARRYQNGEDISKELADGLFLYSNGSVPETRIPFEDKFLDELEVNITHTENGYSVQYHHLTREVSFEEMAQAYLQYFKDEYEDIQKAVAEEEAEIQNNSISTNDTYTIYQIKSGEEYHYKRFERLDGQPEPVNIRDYDLVYQGDLSEIDGDEIPNKLEALFTKFNIDHPDDFKGHSLSVSDVIVIEKNDNQTAYFCDSVGYKELPDFFKEIEQEQTLNSETNIENAFRELRKKHSFNDEQNKWLERIEKVAQKENNLSIEMFEKGAFVNAGGFSIIDHRVFNGQLAGLIHELQQNIETENHTPEELPQDILDLVKEKNREAVEKITVGSQIVLKNGSFEVSKMDGDFSIELTYLDKSSPAVAQSLIGHWKEQLLEQAENEPLVVIIQPEEEKKEKTFAEQVDDVLSGKMPFYSALKVSDTPQLLLSVGCEQLPMLYTQKHLRNAIKPKSEKGHTHGLEVEQIKHLDRLIESPLMVLDSLTSNKSILLVTSEIDKDGLPVMVSVTPNGKGRYELEEVDSNFITSVYGRNNFPEFFKRIVESDHLLYCNKKSQEMFERWGEQYSELTNSLSFDEIIHQSRNIVNTETTEKAEESPQLTFDITDTMPTNHEPVGDIPLVIDDVTIDEPSATKAENFRITDSEIGSGTPLQRFNYNLAAIRLLKELEADGRQASPEEQETLSRYVGWGGLAEYFKESNPHYQELKDLLTEDEYSSARSTTLDSFYTSPVIIDSIYTVLQDAGFKGGTILEPSMGIGHFFGRMPQDMQKNSYLYGVEIDSLTGRIAKQLYPEAHIDIKGFEKTAYKNGTFDVAVGNIPFGDFSLQYDKQSMKIHDYFFMQSLDKVKNGGIVAFVTSKGTLDKRDSTFRKQLSEKADLLGAVRLPNNAFKTAGTEVTADIIFLQKRQEPPEKTPDWVNIGMTDAGLPVNEYFVQHPEMVLGEIVQGNKMFGRTDDTMCVPFENKRLSELLPEAVSKIRAVFDADKQQVIPMENSEVQIPEGIRNYSYFEFQNNIYTIEDNEIIGLKDTWKRSYTPANIERAKAYIRIRDTVRELLAIQQDTSESAEIKIKELQTKLNTQYDSFYKKYGLMHSRFNSQLFRDDSSYPLMLSLEDKVEKDKLLKKYDIFFKRTIRVQQLVDKVDTPQEALVLSLAEKGKIDFDYMSALTDLPVKALISDLKGEIYPEPALSSGDNIVYQTASEYLSGDIYAKLSAAQYAAQSNPVFADNISALKTNIPTPLTAGEIDIECGATWIPKEIYQQFMYETFQTPQECRADYTPRFSWMKRNRRSIELDYSPHTNKWNISNKTADRSVMVQKTFGAADRNAYTIFESVLNLHIPNITKTIPDPNDPSNDIKIMDIEATKLVKRKAESIKKEFKNWIFKDPERRKMLVDLYNRQFNCVRPREYDGTHLQFHGMNASIELHKHQRDAIAHAIYGGNTLFAHCVGAGKTFEMIATAMESKRLGMCSKSLFAVPNHLTEQVGADFLKLYPNANVLVATKQDFAKQNRSKLLAKIATGNYDAVIIGHSQLGMIPLSPERQEKMYRDQIDDITEGIIQLKEKDGESFQVKAMERTRKSLQQKLEKLTSSKKDNTMYFEELGIDKLFVDEAHEFKNLMSVTKLQNVSGISGRTSQRAMELFMKCRYLDEKTGGKGVVFATGTPVSNSITELHTMMRYLQYDFLSEHGMQNFDNWVSIFGKQKTDYELAPTGDKFKARTRIASYANMPELMTMFKQCADVRTSDSLKLPVPDCELHIVNAEPTQLQQELVAELSARADDVQSGKSQPHEDNMLKITGDGRKVGLDPRLVDPNLEDDPNTKLNQCVRNVFQIWQDTAADKMTQIIFCDLGVPKPNQTDSSKDGESEEKSVTEIDSLEESGTFCIYDDIRSKLVSMGIPKEEVAFIHEAKTEQQKSELFEKVRSGKVRVLLGSTAKMGTGTNVQDKLIALHDLDVPWRPADLEQRRGRMVRQGNVNEKVHLYRYVTKGTFDAYSYQLLETKQRFISQVITSKTPARTCSDVDQEALTYSEIKALCTGDERIKEKLTLENRVKELQLFQKEYRDTHFELEDKVAAFPQKREKMCQRIEKLERDFEQCKAIPFDKENKPVFSMTINGTKYSDRKEAAEALNSALDVVYSDRNKSFPIGEIYGFKIFAAYDSVNECVRGILKGELEYSVGLSTAPGININKFEKLTVGIEKHLEDAKKELLQADMDIKSAKEILAQPFEYELELTEKTERLADLTEELNTEAANRLQSAEKKPRTHYFGKAMILSAANKETTKQQNPIEREQSNKKGVGIDV